MLRHPRPAFSLTLVGAALLAAGSVTAAPAVRPARVQAARSELVVAGGLTGAPLGPLSPTAWLAVELEREGRLELPSVRELPLLARYENPAVERPTTSSYGFWTGRYGVDRWQRWPSLALDGTACVPAEPETRGLPFEFRGVELRRHPTPPWIPLGGLDLIPTWALDRATPPVPEVLGVRPEPSCAGWRSVREVRIARYGGEYDVLKLTRCDGSLEADAIDRLSVLMRPPLSDRPGLPLPAEPDPSLANGEWVPGVHLVHPRLVWVVQQIALAFPWRPIYFVSGYRPEASTSRHASGRALDLFVMGIENERLLAFCRTLRDVGCGYYPNNRFVHLDVRPPGSGHALWIDLAGPGEPSRYVDSWPGVVESGALAHSGEI